MRQENNFSSILSIFRHERINTLRDWKGVFHYLKSVFIRSYSGPHSPHSDWIRRDTEYWSISPYSIQMRENAGQNSSEYRHFSHSVFDNRIKVKISCMPYGEQKWSGYFLEKCKFVLFIHRRCKRVKGLNKLVLRLLLLSIYVFK